MSPMVDVAGLMRSLDYAVATTLDPRTPTSAPLPEGTRAKFIKRLRDGAQEAFLDAYRAGAVALPGLDNMDLLKFFMLEKAAYELVYEAANRPTWLSIPLHGLHRLMGRILGEETRSVG
jgi:maltose alpha-D-glucosyltransferase/alpha-amylase